MSIMLKDFYEYIYTDEMKSRKVFSKNIPGSVCYAIGEASKNHTGAIITAWKQFHRYYPIGIREFYVPINADDDREGLRVPDAVELAEYIKKHGKDVKVYGMMTGGCISEDAFSVDDVCLCFDYDLTHVFDGISIGGSFYIPKLKEYGERVDDDDDDDDGETWGAPALITDLRIGEYALFGTIPYNDDPALRGDNALTVQMEVIGVHRERGQIVVKGGYTRIDAKNCTLLSGGLKFVNQSSEYTIYDDPFKRYDVGDIVEVVPDYYSLVKLASPNVEKVFI